MKKILLIMMLSCLMGCQEKKEIIIAEQYGLAYAPVQIMMSKGYLEDLLPDYEIKWVKLGNTMAIREAMTADALDVAFLGIPPYIIGSDNGMDWKLFTGLSRAPLALMGKEAIALEDIDESMKVALPQPGSIQHILLSMAAERSLGEAKYFDKQLVTMKHPDGMQMLLNSDEISFHFTSPPYVFQEEEAGMKTIIDSETCFGGEFTFIVGVTTETFKEDDKAYQAVNRALKQSMDLLNNQREQALEILDVYYKVDKETLSKYLYQTSMTFESEIKGLETFVDFMYRNDYIDKTYTRDDLVW